MMNKKHLKLFQKAMKVALQSDYNKQKMGCIAVLGNKIISTGYNSEKTHSVQGQYNKYRDIDIPNDEMQHKLHAEMNCLHKIMHDDIDWSRVSIYIYRICKSRPRGYARPCKACMAFIRDLGITDIYYTTDNGYAYEYISSIIEGNNEINL